MFTTGDLVVVVVAAIVVVINNIKHQKQQATINIVTLQHPKE